MRATLLLTLALGLALLTHAQDSSRISRFERPLVTLEGGVAFHNARLEDIKLIAKRAVVDQVDTFRMASIYLPSSFSASLRISKSYRMKDDRFVGSLGVGLHYYSRQGVRSIRLVSTEDSLTEVLMPRDEVFSQSFSSQVVAGSVDIRASWIWFKWLAWHSFLTVRFEGHLDPRVGELPISGMGIDYTIGRRFKNYSSRVSGGLELEIAFERFGFGPLIELGLFHFAFFAQKDKLLASNGTDYKGSPFLLNEQYYSFGKLAFCVKYRFGE